MAPESIHADGLDESTDVEVTQLQQERRIGVAVRHITNEFVEDVATKFPQTSIVLGHEFVEFDTTGCEDPNGVMRYIADKASDLITPKEKESVRYNDEIFERAQKGISMLTAEERGSENVYEFTFTVDARVAPQAAAYLRGNLGLGVICNLVDSHKTQIRLFGESLNLYVLVHCLQDYGYHTDNPVLNTAAKSMAENQPFGDAKPQADFAKILRRQRIDAGLSIIHN